MKHNCMTILKVSVALILALMMVVGSISTVVAATITIEQADSVSDSAVTDVADDPADAPVQSVPLTDKLVRLVKDDIAGIGAGVDLAETGYTGYKLSTPKTKGNSTWQDYTQVSSGGTTTVNFKDLGYSENDFVQFGVKAENGDWLAYDGSETNYMGNGSTFNFYKTSNHNAYLKLTKPIVTFTFTTSGNGCSVKTVFSGAFTSTVTAAKGTGGATATVNNAASVSDLANGATVNLNATAEQYYHFDKWTASPSANITFVNKNQAETDATVFGTATVTALFAKDTYEVTLNNPSNGTLTGTTGDVEWGETVSVTATPAAGYKLTNLKYNDGSDHNLYDDSTGSIAAVTKQFPMPKANTTVTATFTQLPTQTVTYGTQGNGYVSVGVAKTVDSEKNMITRSLTSGTDSVVQGTAVNFCAIPQKGYKFVGWYTNSGCNDDPVSTDADYQVTSGYTLYAKFEAAAYKTTSGIRLLFPYDEQITDGNYYLYSFYGTNNTLLNGAWPGKKITELGTVTGADGTQYRYFDTTQTNITYIINNNNQTQTADTPITTGGTYVINSYYDGDDDWKFKTTKEPYAGADSKDIYPVILNVTNPDYGTTYVKAYFEKDGSAVPLHTEPNTQKKVSATQDITSILSNSKTAADTNITVSGSAATTLNVTYANYDNYTVTYNTTGAGKGSVTAKLANGTVVPSGSTVLEDTNVTFTATAESGSYFSTWSDGDTSSTNPVTKTVTGDLTMTANFIVDKYKIRWGSGGFATKDMKLLENGWYISGEIGSNYTFTVYHEGADKYIRPGGTNYWGCTSSVATYTNKFDAKGKWNSTVTNNTAAHFFKNETGAAAYCVYDPATDTMWLTTRDDGLHDIAVYFKNGTIRDGYTETGFHYTSEYGTSSVVTSGYNPTSEYTNRVQKFTVTAAQLSDGVEIELKTVVNANFTEYYVKGFAVNDGLTQGIISQEFDEDTGDELTGYADYDKIHGKAGVESGRPWNSFKLKLKGFQPDNIEITPIYFKRTAKSNDTVRFYANDFTGEVKKDWGGMLAVYSFGGSSEAKNSGIYPGQPMVNEGGRYMMDVPTNDTSITMNNYIWDKVHNDLFFGGVTGDNLNNKHYQTYDYNEFTVLYQIFQESKTAHASDPSVVDLSDEDITFSFKYRNDQTNHGTQETSQLEDRVQYEPGMKTPLRWKSTNGNDPGTKDASIDYTTGYNTIDPNNDIYAFEDLTDFYGNRVDIFGDHVDVNGNSVKAAYNPILAVSNGYDFNSAGDYATAWVLYKPENLTGDPGTYTLLDVIGGQGIIKSDSSEAYYGSESYFILPDQIENIRKKYDASQAASNFVYDLARAPIKISYEYNILDGHANQEFDNKADDGDIAFRSDGRWNYTTSDQMIKSNVIVAIKDGDNYIRDYFQDGGVDYASASGYLPDDNVTVDHGIKAYFANTNYVESEFAEHQNVSGQTVAYAISDGAHTFNLRTEEDPQGEYEFLGWYLYNGKDYILASEDKAYDTESRSNDVFAAVYRKVPGGTVQITHTLDSESPANVEGECFVTVDVVDASGTTVTGGAGTKTSGSVKIGSNFIKYNSTNKLKITLETVPELFANLVKFSESIVSDKAEITGNSISDVTGSTVSLDLANKSVVVTIPIKSLFDGEDHVIKSLPFFSTLAKPTYSYSLTYEYPSYRDNHGTQTYTVADNFTQDELDEYMTRDASGALKFKSVAGGGSTDIYRNTFISNKAPKEDNFMQVIEYTNFDADHLTLSYPNATSVSATLKPVTNEDTGVNVKFDLPYVFNETTYVPTESDGKVIKSAQSKTETVRPLDWFVLSGKRNSEDDEDGHTDDPEFIKAPLIIYDEVLDQNEYFCYWIVKKQASYGKPEAEITRCYDYEFNFSLFMNCTVTPVYDKTCRQTTPPTGWNSWNTYNANDVMKNCGDTDKVSITFLEASRNQYNGHSGTGNPKQADDRIYADFLLNFNGVAKNESGLPYQLMTLTNPKKAGLIVEAVDYLSINENDEYVTSGDMSRFDSTKMYTDEQLSAYISGSSTLSGCAKSEFDTSKLDNKNCIQYYYGLVNRSYTTDDTADRQDNIRDYLENSKQNRYKVFRAYAYLCEADYTSVQLSDPIYFTIYDLASIGLPDYDTRPDNG